MQQLVALETDEEAEPVRRRRAGPTPGGIRLFRLYAALIGPLIGGYLLFDRAFAYLRIPGTPLYIGECLLLVGIGATLLRPAYVRRVLTEETLLTVLVGFMAWGVLRALPEIKTYGVNTVRDSALWYYGLFAIFFVAASIIRPDLPLRLVRQFSRFVPWLLVWLPFALVVPRVKDIPITVPGSPVTVLNHKPGNVAVAASIALAFLWLIPNERRSTTSRNVLSVLALLTIGLDGTQNRGGFLAAGIGVVVALAFLRIRWRLVGRMFVVGLVGLLLALTLAFQVQTGGTGKLGQGRSISGSQLLQNLASVGGGSSTSGNLQATVAFRDRLWSIVYGKEVHSGKLPYGFGFGPNLALMAGIGLTAADNPSLELRSPHNSHLDVLARMGVIGLALWIVIWLGWFRRMLLARRRMALDGDARGKGMAELCVVAAVAILVNAFFDPTLEGAQVAALLWTVFGAGIVISSPRRWAAALRHESKEFTASRHNRPRANITPTRVPELVSS